MRLTLTFALSIACLAGCGPTAPPEDDGGTPPDMDAGSIQSCETAADCDDGRYCTGEEACLDSVCVAGTPIDCDDGVACTQDTCDDVRLRCAHDVPDLDGDGSGDAACLGPDGAPLGLDCDDADPRRFRGNVERCDVAGLDEDCDASSFGAEDLDGDGALSSRCCNGDNCGADCDDTRADVGPTEAEVCNGLDDDCDDADAAVNPAAAEACNGRDDDCNGRADFRLGVNDFEDDDGDGAVDFACAVAGATDCDDNDARTSAGASEVCDGRDNDCDDAIDEDASQGVWYRDIDGDSYGSAQSGAMASCLPIAGYVPRAGDCADEDSAISPGRVDVCNGVDDDCTGVADDGAAATCGPAASCVDGACALDCDSEHADCDGLTDNGCEVDILFNPDHCGGCGQSCGAGGVCSAGDCDEVVALGVGLNFSCAVRRAAVVCWGTNMEGQLGVPAGTPVRATEPQVVPLPGLAEQLAVGESHACVLLQGGAVHCWGANDEGQLGRNPSGGATGLPAEVTGFLSEPIVQLAAGAKHNCVRYQSGNISCWGRGDRGQLGDGNATSSFGPVLVSDPTFGSDGTVQLVLGADFSCAETSAGTLHCWGANDVGQLGRSGMGSDGLTPDFVFVGKQRLSLVAAGGGHACGVHPGDLELWCWGGNEDGQAGGTSGAGLVADVATVEPAIRSPLIYLGPAQTFFADDSGYAAGFGLNMAGQLGDGGTTSRPTPQRVSGNLSVRLFPSGVAADHVCVAANGGVYCWGANAEGQIGVGDFGNGHLSPQRVRGL